MDKEVVKQIVEAIKTINLNINSETGQKAVEHVAQSLGQYLVFKEIMLLLGHIVTTVAVVLVFFLIYKAIKAIVVACSQPEELDQEKALGRFDLDEPDQREAYNKLLIKLFKDRKKKENKKK